MPSHSNERQGVDEKKLGRGTKRRDPTPVNLAAQSPVASRQMSQPDRRRDPSGSYVSNGRAIRP